ncbi:hypothetical protein J6590_084354 [Homalodisca vitripennis]|nr:hypothetical protein J6590_084354 [Homalodisca vitripennis]
MGFYNTIGPPLSVSLDNTPPHSCSHTHTSPTGVSNIRSDCTQHSGADILSFVEYMGFYNTIGPPLSVSLDNTPPLTPHSCSHTHTSPTGVSYIRSDCTQHSGADILSFVEYMGFYNTIGPPLSVSLDNTPPHSCSHTHTSPTGVSNIRSDCTQHSGADILSFVEYMGFYNTIGPPLSVSLDNTPPHSSLLLPHPHIAHRCQ